MNTRYSEFSTLVFAILIGFCSGPVLLGQDVEPLKPVIADSSDEAELAIQLFRFPKSLRANVFAAEPDVANPVAFCTDYEGRIFVCESFRQERGVEDNRKHPEWLNDDLAAQTVADRLAYMTKHLGPELKNYSEQDDRIRLLIDTDGDGQADRSTVFSDRYNRPEMGTGAGVLSYRQNVYYTCIPDLFLLRDEDADGVADVRESLHSGYGVRFAFRGHDLHGLIIGPDRRLYFSIGDRGYNIAPDIHDAVSGAVFRCELDGSELEVIATGLRNPQELAFDDVGNLFTGDNNSDSGDKARWVYVVPGGDSGWRMHYQYLVDRGPFNREKIWHTYDRETTPAYIVPPIENIGDGPSGICFYPGTGLGEHFQNRFFFCDFRGSSANSGIRTFRNRPQGAFFEVADMEQTIWRILATDVDFGSDGKLYVSDWVLGWEGEGKGRIYSFHDPGEIASKSVKQTQELLAGKIATLPEESLQQLLSHRDRRVRQEAQFCLIDRKDVDTLAHSARSGSSLMERLHGLWGVGVLARQLGSEFRSLAGKLFVELAKDKNSEVRGQAINLIRELDLKNAMEVVVSNLSDTDARVRYFSALALNKIGTSKELGLIADFLSENRDADPIIRHGGIMALSGIASRSGKLPDSLIQHESRSVRLATVVAMRKNELEAVSKFLSDSDPQVVLEAARAIYDCPISTRLPDLAKLISQLDSKSDDALIRRVVHANRRMGQAENAEALAAIILKDGVSAERKEEALGLLANWGSPVTIDGVHGDWRPLPAGDARVAANAFAPIFKQTVKDRDLVEVGVDAALKLKVQEAVPVLETMVFDTKRSTPLRAKALRGLDELGHQDIGTILSQLAKNIDGLKGELLGCFCELNAKLNPEDAEAAILQVLDQKPADIAACQMAVAALTKLPANRSVAPILALLKAMRTDELPPAVRLDVVAAARQSDDERVIKQLADYQKYLESSTLPGGQYHDSLYGGNEDRGHQIFYGKTEVSCVRCHMVNAVGGEVGPDLTKVGKERNRIQILESITEPNKIITDGFAQTIVLTDEGLQYSGIVKSRDDELLQLMDADGQIVSILAESIEAEKLGQSSMPADLMKQLSMQELRDLVEFLANRLETEAASTDVERPASHK